MENKIQNYINRLPIGDQFMLYKFYQDPINIFSNKISSDKGFLFSPIFLDFVNFLLKNTDFFQRLGTEFITYFGGVYKKYTECYDFYADQLISIFNELEKIITKINQDNDNYYNLLNAIYTNPDDPNNLFYTKKFWDKGNPDAELVKYFVCDNRFLNAVQLVDLGKLSIAQRNKILDILNYSLDLWAEATDDILKKSGEEKVTNYDDIEAIILRNLIEQLNNAAKPRLIYDKNNQWK